MTFISLYQTASDHWRLSTGSFVILVSLKMSTTLFGQAFELVEPFECLLFLSLAPPICGGLPSVACLGWAIETKALSFLYWIASVHRVVDKGAYSQSA